MSLSIDDLLADADVEIRGLQKTAQIDELPASTGHQYSDDEPVKLAHFLEDMAGEEAPATPPQEKVATQPEPVESAPETEIEDTVFAKVAHAAAIMETVANIGEFQKIADFISQAKEAGHSEEKIAAYLEKQSKVASAATVSRGAIVKGLAALGLITGGTATGHHVGKKQGKKEGRSSGYVSGVRDYHSALKRRLAGQYRQQ